MWAQEDEGRVEMVEGWLSLCQLLVKVIQRGEFLGLWVRGMSGK